MTRTCLLGRVRSNTSGSQKAQSELEPALPPPSAVHNSRSLQGVMEEQPETNSGRPSDNEDPSVSHMIRQPEYSPCSQEKLVEMVQAIHSGLVSLETKCIEISLAQLAQSGSAAILDRQQYEALTQLHSTLLKEHLDFFLTTQHPSGSPTLRALPVKYSMPARMWRHGIQNFLDLLRSRLPGSWEHMSTFFHVAYSSISLLYEEAPAFEDVWIECLGDLARYRMTLEDQPTERNIWKETSTWWYSKASDKAPTTGRLYHHLAISAGPDVLRQLFLFTKSLCVADPFQETRENFLRVFETALDDSQSPIRTMEFNFVRTHTVLFIASNSRDKAEPLPKRLVEVTSEYAETRQEFLSQLASHVEQSTHEWKESGALIGIANNNALLEYGKTDSNPRGDGSVVSTVVTPKAENDAHAEGFVDGLDPPPFPSKMCGEASEFVKYCDSLIFKRYGDENVFPYLHVRLAFLLYVANREPAMKQLEYHVPWTQLASTLTSLTIAVRSFERVEAEEFPCPEPEEKRPLPEDWNLRGLLWTDGLYPVDWFSLRNFDEDQKSFELPSSTVVRRERILWLGRRLANFKKWILYNDKSKQFRATPMFSHEAQALPVDDLSLGETGDAMPCTSACTRTPTTVHAASEHWDCQSDVGNYGSLVVETREAASC